ncbi:MAG TPA: haloacid dehalogenase-like hydrolase [Edaphobacter sp.]|uniref:HAD family hydrolase n=1 Tax=Edaphobacter sp. TaxID=1934404 RepID=UPI002C0DBC41|nr:haloacid dehalogenase-like hydrolase [Edaphobacter sp.]HUZ94462.1 haloacid dehalogenase-like hydrolase [Edaphobacter sp.]
MSILLSKPGNTLLTHRLSTAEFHAAVYDLSPAVAVFDCDGTLWSGDAGSSFMNWTIETGLVSREATDWIDGRYRGYKRGEVSEIAICGEMVQLYQGLREDEMRRAAKKFFESKIEQNIFPEMLELVAELRRRNVDIWAVSSTCDWVIEEGVQRFGIPANRVLAACVTVKDGLVTETICDVPTDEGKVASLARVGITPPDAVFGNSVHDAAMLAIARRAFPVNPTPALVERSAAEGWPVYYPASVAPAS